METQSKYLQDKSVLLLVSANVFLMFMTMVTMALRLGRGGDSYIVQYRANLGLNAFKVGGVTAISSLTIFAILITGLHIALSARIYNLRRALAIVILGMATLLLVLTLIISNSLLILAH